MSDAIEAIRDDVADKYETKRDGLTIDEALEATILGYRVTCDALPKGSYIHYPGDGSWRHEFSHEGRVGSSSAWTPNLQSTESWHIFELRKPQLDGWGRPVVEWPIKAPTVNKWGQPL